MEQPSPEGSGNPEPSEQAKRLAEFMSSEAFQSLPLSDKFASLNKFMTPKLPFTPEDLEALLNSERSQKLREFQNTEEYRNSSGRVRRERMTRFLREVYNKIPPSEAHEKLEAHFQSPENRRRHRDAEAVLARLQDIWSLSSARGFLRRLGPPFPRELTEIADEEELDLPEISELSPRLQRALARLGWEEPAPTPF